MRKCGGAGGGKAGGGGSWEEQQQFGARCGTSRTGSVRRVVGYKGEICV
jgi:hypothetical protein